jgi:hypothetical protein
LSYDCGEEVSKSDPFVATAHRLGWYICYVDLTVEKPGWAFAVSLLLDDNIVGHQEMTSGGSSIPLRKM